jgi:hypothetical protein
MNKDDIIRMAREAGFADSKSVVHAAYQLEAFANLVAKHEREACVKECKKLIKVFLSSKYSTGQPLSSFKERHAVAACIEAIKARGNT